MTTATKKGSAIIFTCSGAIVALFIFLLNKSEEKGVVKEKTNNNQEVIVQYKKETDKKFDEVMENIKGMNSQIVLVNANFINLQSTIIKSMEEKKK